MSAIAVVRSFTCTEGGVKKGQLEPVQGIAVSTEASQECEGERGDQVDKEEQLIWSLPTGRSLRPSDLGPWYQLISL